MRMDTVFIFLAIMYTPEFELLRVGPSAVFSTIFERYKQRFLIGNGLFMSLKVGRKNER